MLEFFHTKERLRFLLYVGVIAVPILIITAIVVSKMESSAAAEGEPNDHGGLHYRIQEKNGAQTLPPALAALLPMPRNSTLTDVNADTDGSGKLLSATIESFTTDDFKTVADFHKPAFATVTHETPKSLWGIRNGYDIKVSQETIDDSDPYKDRLKVEYTITPVK